MPLGLADGTIETVGYIQPQGALVGYHQKTEIISVVSQTLPDFADVDAAIDVLGTSVVEVLGRIAGHDLRNACTLSFIRNQREPITPADLGRGQVAMSAFQTGDMVWVEIEADEPENPSAIMLKDLSRLRNRIETSRAVPDLLDESLSLLRTLAGFDRIQAINVTSTGARVVAEAKRASLDPSIGRALDIPASLSLRHASSIIDVEDTPQCLFASEHARVDLALSSLVAPSTEMLNALQAEGMAASATLPLIVDHNPWGFLWFQHRRPRKMPLRARQALEATLPLINATLAVRLVTA